MAAADALVGESLSISPWKEALAERDALAAEVARLTRQRDDALQLAADAIAKWGETIKLAKDKP